MHVFVNYDSAQCYFLLKKKKAHWDNLCFFLVGGGSWTDVWYFNKEMIWDEVSHSC